VVKGVLYLVMTFFSTDIGSQPFDRRVGSSIGPAYFPLSSAFSLHFPKSLALSFSYFRTLLIYPTVWLAPFPPLISTLWLPFFVK